MMCSPCSVKGAVAVEIAREQSTHASDRAVATLLVEEIVDQATQGSVLAEELVKRPRELAILGGERLAQCKVQGCRRSVVRLVGAMHEPLEFTGDEVDVERDARIAQRDETDLEPPLDHGRPINLGVIDDVRRQFGVVQRKTRDGDVVSLDANLATEIDGFYLPDHRFSSLRYPATDLRM
jgi:hypothetical protein